MAEYVAVAAQEVAANGNVVYTNTAVKGTACVQHGKAAALLPSEELLISARPCYFVDFSANIAVPTGGTAGANFSCYCNRRRTCLIFSDDLHSYSFGSV